MRSSTSISMSAPVRSSGGGRIGGGSRPWRGRIGLLPRTSATWSSTGCRSRRSAGSARRGPARMQMIFQDPYASLNHADGSAPRSPNGLRGAPVTTVRRRRVGSRPSRSVSTSRSLGASRSSSRAANDSASRSRGRWPPIQDHRCRRAVSSLDESPRAGRQPLVRLARDRDAGTVVFPDLGIVRHICDNVAVITGQIVE